MSESNQQVSLRLPAAVIEGLRAVAAKNGRSINKEVAARLQTALEEMALNNASLRDEFAIASLQGVTAGLLGSGGSITGDKSKEVAVACWAMADQMLAVRGAA